MAKNDMGGDPSESPDDQDMTPESAQIPTSAFGGDTPKEGDVCSFKVLSVDSENGMATVQYIPDAEPDADDKGIEGMMSAAQQPGGES